LLIENASPLYADIHLAHTLRDAVTLAELSGLGVCIDFFACWTEAGLRDSIIRAMPRCHLVQVCDYIYGDRSLPSRAVPGDGAIPVKRLIAWILEAGYTGAFDLEMPGPRIAKEGAVAAIRRAANNVTEILQSLHAENSRSSGRIAAALGALYALYCNGRSEADSPAWELDLKKTQKRSSPPSGHDVAALAGVSQAAVSRAFTPGANIADATRARVMLAAQNSPIDPIYWPFSDHRRPGIVGVVMGNPKNPFLLPPWNCSPGECPSLGNKFLYSRRRTKHALPTFMSRICLSFASMCCY